MIRETTLAHPSEEMSSRYSCALQDYLASREEAELQRAYELGRAALSTGTSILDLAAMYHDGLSNVLRGESGGAAAETMKRSGAFFIESLANPGGVISDIEAIARIADDAGVPLLVDNTLATPWLCKPIDYGATLIVVGDRGSRVSDVLLGSVAHRIVHLAACPLAERRPLRIISHQVWWGAEVRAGR